MFKELVRLTIICRQHITVNTIWPNNLLCTAGKSSKNQYNPLKLIMIPRSMITVYRYVLKHYRLY